MLGIPGRPVGIHLGVGRQIEEKDHDFDRASARRHDFYIKLAGVPVPQRFADVDAVANARRELLGARQVGPQDRLGLVAHVAMKALDPVVLGRIRAHSEWIPALAPARLILLLRPGPQLARPPRKSLARQPADHRARAPVRQLAAVDSQTRQPRLFCVNDPALSSPLCWSTRVGTGRLGQGQGEIVAGRLLGRDDQRVEIGRQPPVQQREIADVTEIDRQKLRRDAVGDLGVLLAEPLATSSTISLMPSTERLSSGKSSLRPRS